jgi:hypothetical protein
MVWSINTYVEDILNILKIRSLSINNLFIEHPVNLYTIHNDLYGTLDAGVIDYKTKEIIVWELKYGWSVVDEWENWQGICYLYGLFLKHYNSINQQYTSLNPEKYTFRIVQPRPYCPRGSIREWSTDRQGMTILIEELKETINQVFSKNPPLRTGPECKNCSAIFHCEAAHKMKMNILDVSTSSSTIDLPIEYMGSEYEQLLKAKEMLSHKLTILEEEIYHAIRSGKYVPGWTLDNVRGRAKWSLAPGPIIELGKLYDINLEKGREVITVTQALQSKKIPECIIDYVSERPARLKLVKDDGRKARQIFGR